MKALEHPDRKALCSEMMTTEIQMRGYDPQHGQENRKQVPCFWCLRWNQIEFQSLEANPPATGQPRQGYPVYLTAATVSVSLFSVSRRLLAKFTFSISPAVEQPDEFQALSDLNAAKLSENFPLVRPPESGIKLDFKIVACMTRSARQTNSFGSIPFERQTFSSFNLVSKVS